MGKKLDWLKEHINGIGGFIGALTAIVTVPAVFYGIWKSGHELYDVWTAPTLSGSAAAVTLRCDFTLPPESDGPTYNDCAGGKLAVSSLVSFQNLDLVPRSIVGMSVGIKALSGNGAEFEHVFDRVRLVRHETRNWVDGAVISEWNSTNFGPRTSTAQEFIFSNISDDSYAYSAFLDVMTSDDPKARWSDFIFTIDLDVLGHDEQVRLLACTGVLVPEVVESKANDLSRQNQYTFACANI